MLISSNVVPVGTSKMDHHSASLQTHLHHSVINNNSRVSNKSNSNNNNNVSTTATITQEIQDSFPISSSSSSSSSSQLVYASNPIRINSNSNNNNNNNNFGESHYHNESDSTIPTNQESSFLSKSLGSHTAMYMYRERISKVPNEMNWHRHISDVSSISYSGYLLKRSNLPYQPKHNNNNNNESTTTPTDGGYYENGNGHTTPVRRNNANNREELEEYDIFCHTPTPSVHDMGRLMALEEPDEQQQQQQHGPIGYGPDEYKNEISYYSNGYTHITPLHAANGSMEKATIYNTEIGNSTAPDYGRTQSITKGQYANPQSPREQSSCVKGPLGNHIVHVLQSAVGKIPDEPIIQSPPQIDVAMQFAASLLDFDWNSFTRIQPENIDQSSIPIAVPDSLPLRSENIVTSSPVVVSMTSNDMNSGHGEALSGTIRQGSKPIKMPSTVLDDGNSSITPTSPDPLAPNLAQHHHHQITPTSRSVSDCTQPSDFIDPKDGHIWRAKYCVLEGQCLFFYSHEADAHSPEATQERQQYERESHLPTNPIEREESKQPERPQQQQQQRMLSSRSTPSLLSQSPMTRCHVLRLPLQQPNDENLSGTTNGSGRNTTATLHLYEKVVPLECVGAVRSAELEYGPNTIELSAVLNDGNDDDNGVNNNNTNDSEKTYDTLVIRASNNEEMKEWMFQFQRSIATFVRDIMDHLIMSAGDIHHRAYQHNALLVPQLPLKTATTGSGTTNKSQQGVRPPTLSFNSMKSNLANPLSDMSPARSNYISTSYSALTFSPRYQKMLCGAGAAGSFNSLTPFTYTHGHGRNSMHRRRGTFSPTSTTSAISTIEIPASTEQIATVSSAHTAEVTSVANVTPCIQPFMLDTEDTTVTQVHQGQMELDTTPSSFRHPPRPSPVPYNNRNSAMRQGPTTQKDIVPLPNQDTGITRCVSETAISQRKYIPPHLRRKLEASTGAAVPGTDVKQKPAESNENTYVPRSQRRVEQQNMITKLGGCADPLLRVGSIVDEQYKPREASKLKKVRSVPHGHFSDHHNSFGTTSLSRLQWELGAVSECGAKNSNEDSYLVTSNLLKVFAECAESGKTNESKTRDKSECIWEKLSTIHPPGLFAIFDGHCGDQASRFAAERIARFIHEKSCEFVSNEINNETPVVEHIKQILDTAIRELDTAFCNLCVEDSREWESGSTALIATLVNEHLVIANLGDSRGILCRTVKPADADKHMNEGWNQLPPEDNLDNSRKYLWKAITEVHTPGQENEQRRINQANGWVTMEQEIPVSQLQRMALYDDDVIDILKRCFADHYTTKAAAPQRIIQTTRVCGELAVSRALGDREFKATFQTPCPTPDSASDQNIPPEAVTWQSPISLPFPENHSGQFVGDLISNVPDFQTIRIGQENTFEEFLLLACDGLWDVMDPDDAFRVARDLLFDKKWSAEKTAARLAELAIRLGSSDNITVIVVRFFLGDSNNQTMEVTKE